MNRHWIQKYGGTGLVTGCVTWILLLIISAQHVQNSSSASSAISFTGLTLNRLTKHYTAHGYTVSITFEWGLLWFMLTCVAVSILIGFMVHTKGRKQQHYK